MVQSKKNTQTRTTGGATRPTAASKPSGKSGNTEIVREERDASAFGRRNFISMAIAGVLIVVGFLLMVGPSSTPDNFEPDIFSTRRIVVGPTLAFLGFVAMAVAIIIRPTKAVKTEASDEDSTRVVTEEKA